MTALVYGIVRAADTGWADPLTVGANAGGFALLGDFRLADRTAAAPIMPLHLFSDRGPRRCLRRPASASSGR